MATIIKEIEVDVSQLNRFAAIVAKQYDKQSRFLKVTLLDSGERIKVESASTAVINARREDKVAKTFEGTVNADGTVTVPLTYWMLQLDGTVKCDISIITANKTVLSTTLFELEVQEAAAPDDSEIENGLWKEKRVRDAVVKGWISPENFKEITGEDYDEQED